MLLGKNFDDMDGGTIQPLIESGAVESVHLEFKRETYGHADRDKKEFLKDISSFANSLGGHLVIGVEEKGGAARALHPLTGLDVDGELQWLETVARTGIEPPIVGLRMKRIPVSGGDVIVVHVPRSHNPPHRVIAGNTNRYYSRSSANVYELPLEELRRLFGERRSIEEQARTFIEERFLRIQAGDAPMPIPVKNGVTVLHLVPLPDLGARRRLDIATLRAQSSNFRPMERWQSASNRINLDGLVTFDTSSSGCRTYTQIFRDGSLEAVSTSLMVEWNGKRLILSGAFTKALIKSATNYINGLRSLGASPPILMRMSFSGMRGVELDVDRSRFWQPSPYEREVLHLPHTIFTEYPSDGNYHPFIAEQMDFLWNAYGFERCLLFEENGN